MATIIKSVKDLDRLLEQCASLALQMAQKDVAVCIQESIDEYYKEKVFNGGLSATPEEYARTYKLLNSLGKTNIVRNGNTLSCEVKIDDSYLNYRYPNTMNWVPATGYDVLTWNNNDGSHGGTVSGNWHIWDEALRTLGGDTGIMAILIDKLKKCRINVT